MSALCFDATRRVEESGDMSPHSKTLSRQLVHPGGPQGDHAARQNWRLVAEVRLVTSSTVPASVSVATEVQW